MAPRLLFLASLSSVALRGAFAIDCNGNGKPDVVETSAGTAPDCNANRVPDECEVAPLPFRLADVQYFQGRLRGLTLADLDRNGALDIVATSAAGNQNILAVLLRRGNGGWSWSEHPSGVLAGPALAAADLDGDGGLDVASGGSSGVSVRFNEGGGALGEALEVAAAEPTSGLRAGDLDGDGLEDIVSIRVSSDTVTVVFGDSSRGLTRSLRRPVGGSPRDLALADLDSDGDLEVVTVNIASRDLSILRNRGAGSLEDAERIPLTEERPFRLAAVDLDSDGHADLAAGHTEALTVLLNDGGGGLHEPSVLHFEAVSLAAGDLDGDGDLDLAAGRGTFAEVELLVNLGGGTLVAAQRLVLAEGLRERVALLALGDLDGDALPDAATAAQAAGSLSIFQRSGGVVLEAVSFSQAEVAAPEPHGAAMGDLDGDGALDVATTADGRGTVTLTFNDGVGALARQ
ncbi:MAG: VCBS repeat-containing protein, partial [Planctomycetes bacterium]|nr:VCBS repeat-containing protein [Planctomycetota bacterium]